jgi:hypothetical protein
MVKQIVELGDADDRAHVSYVLVGDGNIVPGTFAW